MSSHRSESSSGSPPGRPLTQIVSDVTGRGQQVPEQTIGASYGDALMAAIGVGLVPPETDWARTGRTISPPADSDTYETSTAAPVTCTPQRILVHQLALVQQEQAVAR